MVETKYKERCNVFRSEKNPVINPEDVRPSRSDFKVVCVFNCGVIRFGGEILLLMRVAEVPLNQDPGKVLVPLLDTETSKLSVKAFDRKGAGIDLSDSRFVRTKTRQYLSSISHLRIARSRNGIDFTIDDEPAMFPSNVYERFGIEDPRITMINGKYYINYSAISDIAGVTTCLASTEDFKTFKRHGVMFTPDNKDVAVFPEKINGRYYALNRPASGEYNTREMWISESPDLICWGNHRHLMSIRPGYWDDGRIGCGAVPIKTPEGWLEIYHGASKQDRYCLGAVLLDKKEPWRILARSKYPIMEPLTEYEIKGFFGNVIFSCGLLFEREKLKIYYGASDTCICYAEVKLKDIMKCLE